MKKSYQLKSLILATTIISGSPLSFAQQDNETTSSPNQRTVLPTTIVTAQRVEENLQDVSASVTALDAGMIATRQILDASDIGRIAPNVKFEAGTGSTTILTPYIRGGGSSDGGFVLSESEVSLYINDVYMSRMQGALMDIGEVERIEVLRGPQGVLYGRNSSAGAVNIITRQPSDEFEASAQIGYGSWDEKRFKGHISTPLNEDASWRAGLSTMLNSRDGGRQFNTTLDKDVGEEEYFGLRGELAYVGDKWNSRVNLFHIEGQSDGQWAVNTTVNSTGEIIPISGSYHTVLSPAENSFTDLKQNGATANIAYDYEGGTVKYIGGWSELKDSWYHDFSGGVPWENAPFLPGGPGVVFELYGRGSDSDQSQYSNELQFTGDFGSGFVEYVAGLYHFTETAEQHLDTTIFFVPSVVDWETDTTSLATYGQLTFNLSESVKLLVGGRYTDEEKSMDAVFDGTIINSNNSYSKFTPKIGIDWKVSDATLLYASYSEGFKAGGYNALASSAGQLADPFEPQLTKAYEVGIKTDIADVLRVNIAGFHNQIEDRQQSVNLGDGGWIIENYDADISGLELELTWVITDNLTLWGNGAINDGEYKATDSELGSLLGNDLPSLPDHSFNFGLDYAVAIGHGEFGIGADYQKRDNYFSNPDNQPIDYVEPQEKLNAYVSYKYDSWTFQIAGKNLTNEESWQTGFGFSVINPRYATEPRSILGTVKYDF